MDTSEEYIEMCDCEEVQGVWALEVGDLVRLQTELISDHRYFVSWIGDVWIGISSEKTRSSDNGFRRDSQSKLLWLPRQDQLQGMIQSPDASAYFTLHIFYEWIQKNCIYDNSLYKTWIGSVGNTSMEQLWLAFIMHKLHSKRWNREKWEDEI